MTFAVGEQLWSMVVFPTVPEAGQTVNRRTSKQPKGTQQRSSALYETHHQLRRRLFVVVATIVGLTTLSALAGALAHGQTPVIYGFEVVGVYPHDERAFCQGLAVADGILHEGTGKYGKSVLRKVDLATGKVLQQVPLDSELFGEGITVWEERILQVTWRSGVGIIYEKDSLRQLGRFRIRGEGWGLTNDGEHLILSNGTEVLQFLDPRTFRVTRRLTVHDRGLPIRNLNELEYVDGEIMANVWMTDRIARISAQTGSVTAWIDLRGLAPAQTRRDPEAVLNGIAYDAKTRRLFVTGKNWPTLFEIRLKQRYERASQPPFRDKKY